MSKLRVLAGKCAVTAYTAVTFVAALVTTLFPKRGSSVTTPIVRRLKPLVRSKMPKSGAPSDSSVGTFPNSSQEHEKEARWAAIRERTEGQYVTDNYPADEYDHEDYDDYLSDHGDANYYEPEITNPKSWHERAVDEAIEEEVYDEYPRTDRTHGDW